MLDSLITSKTRMKLLLKFFSNAANRAYLRGLAQELGENTNAVRIELNRLAEAGLLESEPKGNTVEYRANTKNPFFRELHRLVLKYIGVDSIVEEVVQKLGTVELAFISGDYARGLDSGIIDLVMVGEIADPDYLQMLHRRGEEIAGRRIRLLTLNKAEFDRLLPSLQMEHALILWAAEQSNYRSRVSQ